MAVRQMDREGKREYEVKETPVVEPGREAEKPSEVNNKSLR